MRDENVEVADASEHAAEPRKLRAELLLPFLLEDAARRSQRSPRPSGGHAHPVHAFGVAAEPRAFLVLEDRVARGGEHPLQELGRAVPIGSWA